jgi:hypothetical protein
MSISDLFSWHEALPNVGKFLNEVGFPMAIWLITIFILYKVFYSIGYKALAKLWNKVEPIIDAHFDLVITMKDNLSKQTDIMSKTNSLIESKFDEQNGILSSHSEKLTEISDNQIKHLVDHGIYPTITKAAGSNGIKR